ncbi:hypothetical protein OG481_13800 [Streptomyces longwoodensis]|uniref:hypothetical protein n=1 Tax=Streptomyces longwoodensis TaxID=68231 RepID=UPI002DDAD43C|nr:hypothetical protein [Streptomyces longwoodensis]WRY89507.1 hypothetical protein OG481_13800 [Streptomyces longwoodensis]
MKELVLALVAAVFGLAGTVVGARAAKKGALISAEATLQQVRDQADVDQAHWLRQQRLQAYEGFLAAWDECLRIIDSVGLPGRSDSPGINPLKEATGRMAERARRIDILGPAEVARAAEELAVSIRRDVDLATKLMELADSQRPAAERITSGTVPAMTSAVEAMEEATRQMQELMAEVGDVRVPPGANVMFEAFERAEELANAAITQAHEDNDAFTVFLEEATAIVAELESNQEAREGIRERFTTAARHTLDSATP